MDSNYVKLQSNDLGSNIKPGMNIFEEFCEIHLKVDHCIVGILSIIKKLEKTCLDKKLLRYYVTLLYNLNQIKEWRKMDNVGKEELSEILSYWYHDSLWHGKRIVKRLKKNKDFADICTKVSDYVDRMKIIIHNPRYLYM